MEDFTIEFQDAIKGEKDRRILLQKNANKEIILPSDAVASQNSPQIQENLDLEMRLEEFREKLEKFSNFKEGANAEIDYYAKIYTDQHHYFNLPVLSFIFRFIFNR